MNIDWIKLKIHYGDASYVPSAVRQLCSTGEEVRKNAYWSLDSYIVVQGLLYESAYYCIDELFTLLRNDSCDDNYYIFELLTEIALGSVSVPKTRTV